MWMLEKMLQNGLISYLENQIVYNSLFICFNYLNLKFCLLLISGFTNTITFLMGSLSIIGYTLFLVYTVCIF